MVAQNARKALEDENKLLEELEQKAAGNARWVAYFSGWRKNNADLISKAADSDFDREVNDEIKRLQKMRDSLSGDSSAGAKFYTDALDDDIQGTRALL